MRSRTWLPAILFLALALAPALRAHGPLAPLKTVEEFNFSVQPQLHRPLLGSCFSSECVARGAHR